MSERVVVLVGVGWDIYKTPSFEGKKLEKGFVKKMLLVRLQPRRLLAIQLGSFCRSSSSGGSSSGGGSVEKGRPRGRPAKENKLKIERQEMNHNQDYDGDELIDDHVVTVDDHDDDLMDDADISQLRKMLMSGEGRDLEASYKRFRVPILKAEAHLEKGRYAEAIALYEETARKFAPNHYFGDLYMGLGCAYMGLEQPQMAVEQFQKGLTFDPLNLHIWMNLGIAQVSVSDLAAAVETFNDARSLAMEAREEMMAQQCALYVGQISEDLGDEAKALEVYKEAIEFAPSYSQIWYLAGCLLHKQGDHGGALFHFEKAIQCPSPWPSAYYKLSKLVTDPEEKKKLFNQFIAAQKEMTESGNEPEVLSADNSTAANMSTTGSAPTATTAGRTKKKKKNGTATTATNSARRKTTATKV